MSTTDVTLAALAIAALVATIAAMTTASWRSGGRCDDDRVKKSVWLLGGTSGALGALGANLGDGHPWAYRAVLMLAVVAGLITVIGFTHFFTRVVLRLLGPPGPASNQHLGVPSKSRVRRLRSGLRPVQ